MSTIEIKKQAKKAKPFLKWAGGKGQLLKQFDLYFPEQLKRKKGCNYFEPFIGGGAVFFHVAQKYNIKQAFLCDINEELILTYNVIKNDVTALIQKLLKLEEEYLSLTEEERKNFFYTLRLGFNKDKANIDFDKYSTSWVKRAAQIIFLNKTCFNGLFRVNSKGGFNVPIGKYKNPKILDEDNLICVSEILHTTNTVLKCADFESFESLITNKDFVYFDPPYRPISQTSSFKSYSKNDFNDFEQKRLASFFSRLNKKGAKLMLSNSDPKNENPNDNFFDELYKDFKIKRINANRMINCNAKRRGKIKELLVTNF